MVRKCQCITVPEAIDKNVDDLLSHSELKKYVNANDWGEKLKAPIDPEPCPKPSDFYHFVRGSRGPNAGHL